jgi:hypothetical protein
VVAAHGGTVTIEDAPGGGALFRVRLPAAAEGTPVPVAMRDDAHLRPEEPPEPVRPGQGPAAPSVPEPVTVRTPRPAPAPAAPPVPTPVHRPVPRPRPMPLRDDEARLDPDTAPRGIPVVRSGRRRVPRR